MVENGIIEPLKVDECSKWCNSFVVVRKPSGDVWLCIDPAKLNRAIIRPIHRGQTVSDVLSKLSGVKYFSLLDAKHGFWNLQLDDESSKLTMFVTPYGCYRFKHLPYGCYIFSIQVPDAYHLCDVLLINEKLMSCAGELVPSKNR